MDDRPTWLEDFHETCEDILHDTILLCALADFWARWPSSIPQEEQPGVLRLLTGFLRQHALELYRLEKHMID